MHRPVRRGDTEARRFVSLSVPPWFGRIALWFLPLSFLLVAFFYPLSRILTLTFDPRTLTTENFLLALNVFLFTLYQATLSTFLTLLLGLPSAYLFARYHFYGKPLLRALTAVPFMLPTVVVAASFNALLGSRGLINTILQPTSFILHPSPFILILLAHVFYNTTIIIRIA